MSDDVYDQIEREVRRAQAKFPSNRLLLPALMEEVGELAEALSDADEKEIHKEAIQVAAVAIRILLEGDSSYDASAGEEPFVGFLVRHTGKICELLLKGAKATDEAFRIECLNAIRTTASLAEDGDASFDVLTEEERVGKPVPEFGE